MKRISGQAASRFILLTLLLRKKKRKNTNEIG